MDRSTARRIRDLARVGERWVIRHRLAGRIGDRRDRLDRDGRDRRDRGSRTTGSGHRADPARRTSWRLGERRRPPAGAIHCAPRRPISSRSRFRAGWPSPSRSANGRCGPPAASPAEPTPASPSATPGCRIRKAARADPRIRRGARHPAVGPGRDRVERGAGTARSRLATDLRARPRCWWPGSATSWARTLPDPEVLVSEQLDTPWQRGVRREPAERRRPADCSG